jgi:hypothetical protein
MDDADQWVRIRRIQPPMATEGGVAAGRSVTGLPARVPKDPRITLIGVDRRVLTR